MNRRNFATLAGAAAASTTMLAACATAGPAPRKPGTYVLVHGAYHGAWCWKDVAAMLRAQGHTVYTPTQTGLGERSHLIGFHPTLDTFIEDVTRVIEMEELNDIVLVGHSFAVQRSRAWQTGFQDASVAWCTWKGSTRLGALAVRLSRECGRCEVSDRAAR